MAADADVEGGGGVAAGSPRWEWTLLPRLPEGAQRWLGAAGVVDGWLVLAAGANACGFEAAEAGTEQASARQQAAARAGHDPCSVPCTDGERCPPWLPSYRLRLSGPKGFADAWAPMARCPDQNPFLGRCPPVPAG